MAERQLEGVSQLQTESGEEWGLRPHDVSTAGGLRPRVVVELRLSIPGSAQVRSEDRRVLSVYEEKAWPQKWELQRCNLNWISALDVLTATQSLQMREKTEITTTRQRKSADERRNLLYEVISRYIYSSSPQAFQTDAPTPNSEHTPTLPHSAEPLLETAFQFTRSKH